MRPPSLDSKLHKNMTLALSPEKKARTSIKAQPVLEDFAQEHMANLERDVEQRKIRCCSFFVWWEGFRGFWIF